MIDTSALRYSIEKDFFSDFHRPINLRDKLQQKISPAASQQLSLVGFEKRRKSLNVQVVSGAVYTTSSVEQGSSLRRTKGEKKRWNNKRNKKAMKSDLRHKRKQKNKQRLKGMKESNL